MYMRRRDVHDMHATFAPSTRPGTPVKQLKPSPAEDALLVFAQCSVFMSLMVICGLCLTSDGMRELVNQGKLDHTCPKVIIKMEEEARRAAAAEHVRARAQAEDDWRVAAALRRVAEELRETTPPLTPRPPPGSARGERPPSSARHRRVQSARLARELA